MKTWRRRATNNKLNGVKEGVGVSAPRARMGARVKYTLEEYRIGRLARFVIEYWILRLAVG